MEKKICFKCNTEKYLDLFYKHKGMSDGHLNKCIDCTKNYTNERGLELRKDIDFVEKEKERHRAKYYRLKYKDIHKPSKEKRKEINLRYFNKYPEKIKAKYFLGKKIKLSIVGNHLHHWSYNKEHWLDVIELSVYEHNKIHRYMIYDQERMMYRRIDNNELLDTKENHLEYYEYIKNNKN